MAEYEFPEVELEREFERTADWVSSFKGIVSHTLDWPTCPTCRRPAPPEILNG
jgi:hypothetical protein